METWKSWWNSKVYLWFLIIHWFDRNVSFPWSKIHECFLGFVLVSMSSLSSVALTVPVTILCVLQRFWYLALRLVWSISLHTFIYWLAIQDKYIWYTMKSKPVLLSCTSYVLYIFLKNSAWRIFKRPVIMIQDLLRNLFRLTDYCFIFYASDWFHVLFLFDERLLWTSLC